MDVSPSKKSSDRFFCSGERNAIEGIMPRPVLSNCTISGFFSLSAIFFQRRKRARWIAGTIEAVAGGADLSVDLLATGKHGAVLGFGFDHRENPRHLVGVHVENSVRSVAAPPHSAPPSNPGKMIVPSRLAAGTARGGALSQTIQHRLVRFWGEVGDLIGGKT